MSPITLPERKAVRWVRSGPDTGLQISWPNPQRKSFPAEVRDRPRGRK